jgi:hypothetical protein
MVDSTMRAINVTLYANLSCYSTRFERHSAMSNGGRRTLGRVEV